MVTGDLKKPMAEASAALFEDWSRRADSRGGGPSRRALGEPGHIALRARWHYLRRLSDNPPYQSAHRVEASQWDLEVALESEGDQALVKHDLDVAEDRFTHLLDLASHPVVVVESLTGLADVARHRDEIAEAEVLYLQAIGLADSIDFSFGSMRARLPLAYLIRRSGSAEQMLTIATECEESAIRLEDRGYVGNALVAQGEALDLLRRTADSITVLSRAVEIFESVGSAVGVAGAGLRLLDVHRRKEDTPAILALAPRVVAATSESQQFQESVDVYDVLAYAHVKCGDFADAHVSCQEGIQLAGDRYPRAVAHLRMTDGRALRRMGRSRSAVETLLLAHEYFAGRAEDLGMVAYCLGELALCAEDLDECGEAVELQLRAMEAIEGMRSRQERPRWQQEYRDRFDTVYRAALTTTVRCHDPIAFAAVFESLWGRRLSGVTQGAQLDPNQDPVLIAQLLARNDRARWATPATDRKERLRRTLGRVALSGALPERYADATDPALAASYRPLLRDEAGSLLEGVTPEAALLLITEVPGRRGQIAWLSRAPYGEFRVGQRDLTDAELRSIDQWSGRWPVDANADQVAGLAELLPAELRELAESSVLHVVPLERLWSLPWSALPVGPTFLGAQVELLISPSLALARTGAGRLGPAIPANSRVVACIGPQVSVHDLAGLGRAASNARSVDAGDRAIRALVHGDADAVVVVAHGRPIDGLGHYLELGAAAVLTPIEMFSAAPPPSLALLCCWGARVFGVSTGDPLTLATIAMARGSRQILTTVSELGDSATAAEVVNDILSEGVRSSWSRSLRWALNRHAEELIEEPLVDWAALITLGGW